MEGASKGGPKPHQQNKPKQNKHQNKKGGGGGNSKGQGNPSSGGPKPQKTGAPEVSVSAPPVDPAKLSIEVTSSNTPGPVTEEVKPTGNEPQEQKPTPKLNLLPEQRAEEKKDAGKGNRQSKGNKSKSPAKGGPQNETTISATECAQVPTVPVENLEGMVPRIKTEPVTAKATSTDGEIISAPTTQQQSVPTNLNKDGARGKSPCMNNKNSKGGKGNKGGNPPNKQASLTPRPTQQAQTPEVHEQEKNPSDQLPLQGTPTGIAEVPKASEERSVDPKSTAHSKIAPNSSKRSKPQGKVSGNLSQSDDVSEPVVSTDMIKTIPVENPQSFAEKAKPPTPKGAAQVEKPRAESPAKIQKTQPKNKAGKGGSSPQLDIPLVDIPPAAPSEQPRFESSAPHPGKIDSPKNQQSSSSKPQPSSWEQKECEPKNSQKKRPAKHSSSPVKCSESKGDQTSASLPKTVTSAKQPVEAVTDSDFEPLFSDLSTPVAKLSHLAPKEPAVKETPKQSVNEAPKGETVKSTVGEAPRLAVAKPSKPVTQEITKETQKPTSKETAKPIVQRSPKPAVQKAPELPPTVDESEDADFDPLFSDLTDSTKVLVGVACPFVDKFPPLIPPAPAPKPLTPEPQQQSTKSKSPPNKDQTISKSAAVEIKAPLAHLPSSPLQGESPLPESWKDKVLYDVKLSSTPKPSSSAKVPEGVLKKEENKNHGNGNNANAPAPIVPFSEPAKVTLAITTPVPLMSKEPKPDVCEPSNGVVKKTANQKSSPPKAIQKGAQGASKAPLEKNEDGACSTKLQKGNPTRPEPTNQLSRPAVKKDNNTPVQCKNLPCNNPPINPPNNPPNNAIAPEITPKKKKTFKGTKKDRKNKKQEKEAPTQNGSPLNSLAGEVAKARQHIKNSLQCIDDIANMTSPSAVVEVSSRLNTLEKENSDLKHKVGDLTALLAKLEIRVKELEKGNKSVGLQAVTPNSTVASQAVAKAAHASSQASANVKTAGSQAKSQPAKQDDDDDGVDLFASDSEEENEEANKIKEQRLAEYAAKKGKKPALIAKSSVILDVKPWDDETDMKEMEKRVREIKADGLLWGASKLVPLAYGIHKLQINCVVEDEKISIDWLQETIEGIEDYVQSVDIAAFNKI